MVYVLCAPMAFWETVWRDLDLDSSYFPPDPKAHFINLNKNLPR